MLFNKKHHEACADVKIILPIKPSVINNKTTEMPIIVLSFLRIPYTMVNKKDKSNTPKRIEEDMNRILDVCNQRLGEDFHSLNKNK
jgi:hypothetical protein